MTSPRRRPLRRDNLDIETTLRRALGQAPEIELGWSILRHDINDLGYREHTPTSKKPGGIRIAIRCRTCGELLDGSTEKDDHRTANPEHTLYAYTPIDLSAGPSVIDYTDTTGDLALRLDTLADDLDSLQFHWQRVQTSLRALAIITRRHIPPSSPAVPACTVTTCNGTVEPTSTGNGYRGMELVAGHWVARPGERPVCAKHRSQERRGAA